MGVLTILRARKPSSVHETPLDASSAGSSSLSPQSPSCASMAPSSPTLSSQHDVSPSTLNSSLPNTPTIPCALDSSYVDVPMKAKPGILINNSIPMSTTYNDLTHAASFRDRSSSIAQELDADEEREQLSAVGPSTLHAKRTSSAGNPCSHRKNSSSLHFVPRAASHVQLSQYGRMNEQQRSQQPESPRLTLVTPTPPPRAEKHVAYATAFDGSIVRRREMTTSSSTGSQDSRCSQSTSTAVHSSPQHEYSRVYYSDHNKQSGKRRGLRAILAR